MSISRREFIKNNAATAAATAAGISLPNGFGERDSVVLPTGLQLVCAPFRDSLLLRIAHQYEQLSGWRYEPPEWIQSKMTS